MTVTTVTCVQITCDICGTLYDLEGEGCTQHFGTITEAVKSLRDDEWTSTDTGYAVCPVEDDEHDSVRAELAPKPPQQQIPGQTDLLAAAGTEAAK